MWERLKSISTVTCDCNTLTFVFIVIAKFCVYSILSRSFLISDMRIGCLFVFVCLMVGLYISPLFIECPCVILSENLPEKPKLVAHRGDVSVSMLYLLLCLYDPYPRITNRRLIITSLDKVLYLGPPCLRIQMDTVFQAFFETYFD